MATYAPARTHSRCTSSRTGNALLGIALAGAVSIAVGVSHARPVPAATGTTDLSAPAALHPSAALPAAWQARIDEADDPYETRGNRRPDALPITPAFRDYQVAQLAHVR